MRRLRDATRTLMEGIDVGRKETVEGNTGNVRGSAPEVERLIEAIRRIP
jgi:hypothetical protein